MFDEAEAVVIQAVVEFLAAWITGDGSFDRADAVNDREAVRALVGVVALHGAPFEGEIVKRLLAWDAEIIASGLPLDAMRVDAAAAMALVSDEVSELVLEGAPELFGLAVFEFGIEFDGAIWPPRPASGRLHPWVP